MTRVLTPGIQTRTRKSWNKINRLDSTTHSTSSLPRMILNPKTQGLDSDNTTIWSKKSRKLNHFRYRRKAARYKRQRGRLTGRNLEIRWAILSSPRRSISFLLSTSVVRGLRGLWIKIRTPNLPCLASILQKDQITPQHSMLEGSKHQDKAS